MVGKARGKKEGRGEWGKARKKGGGVGGEGKKKEGRGGWGKKRKKREGWVG